MYIACIKLVLFSYQVTTTIGNLILGKIYVDHGGIMKVRNHTAGLTARLAFKEQGLLRSKDLHQVGSSLADDNSVDSDSGCRLQVAGKGAASRGAPGSKQQKALPQSAEHLPRFSPCPCACAQVTGTFERGKQKLAKPVLSGKWDEGMAAELEDGSTVQMWRKNPPPPDPTRCGRSHSPPQMSASSVCWFPLLKSLQRNGCYSDCCSIAARLPAAGGSCCSILAKLGSVLY